MVGVPSTLLFSRGTLGRRSSGRYVLPSNNRPAPLTRGTSGRKFRHRGSGGIGGRHPLVRFLVRSICSPRVLLLGLVSFLFLPSLNLFEPAEHRLKEADSRHLAEPDRLAASISAAGSEERPEATVTEQHPRNQEHQQEQQQLQRQQSAEHRLKEADSRHVTEPDRLAASVSAGSEERPERTVTEQHPRNQDHQQEHQHEQQQRQEQQSAEHGRKEADSRHLAEPERLAADMSPGSDQHQEPTVTEHQQEQNQQRQQPPSAEDQPEIEEEVVVQATKRIPASTTPPWKPPSLPVEVSRDVPLEECLVNPLWEMMVDPYFYDFGCDEIEAMLDGDITLIGSGMIRDVYLVEHEGQKLVLKVLREDYELIASKSWIEDIHRWEAAALDAVRGHPHIVGLLGFCESISVSEYFEARLEDLVLKPGAKPLPIESVVSMALDAARGLQALHEVEGGAIIHFDIKPQQMMLDGEGRLKINDLNMCKFVDADADGNTCPLESPASNPGPFRSPENIAGEPLTEKVDVYSMAMTFYTMLSLHPPYTGELGAKERILNGIPPSVDPSWHPGFVEIMRDMWQRDPKARPSARRVAERLEILQIQMMLEAAKR